MTTPAPPLAPREQEANTPNVNDLERIAYQAFSDAKGCTFNAQQYRGNGIQKRIVDANAAILHLEYAKRCLQGVAELEREQKRTCGDD